MKYKLIAFVTVLFMALPVCAQVWWGPSVITTTSLPATCTPGDPIYQVVSGGPPATVGTVYICSATNTFTAVGSTSGTVTSVSVVTANGYSASVVNPTTTPAITIACATCAQSSNNLSFFSATSSAQLLALLSDKSGSGLAVFNNSPSFTTPSLGAALATSINGNIITTGTGILTLGAGKTTTFDHTSTFTTTDAAVYTFPSISASIAPLASPIFTGQIQFPAGTATTPAQVFTGDTGIGVYDIAANHIYAIHTGTDADFFVRANPAGTVQIEAGNDTAGADVPLNIVGSTVAIKGGFVAITSGKTFTLSNSITFAAGADSITETMPATSFTTARTDAANTFTGHQTIEGVTSTGATGTGKFVFDTAPTFPTTVAITGALTPSQTAGIVGTTTNNNANAGAFGEYQTGTVAANTTSMTSPNAINVGTNTNITLTAGDWDCSGAVNFTTTATTSITNLSGGISTSTGALPAQDSYFDYTTAANVPTAAFVTTWVVPTVRLSLSGSTNVFLVAKATFSASTLVTGGTIRCRRMR